MPDNPFAGPEAEVDELDLQIARYVMNRTWWAAGSAASLAVLSTCGCNPLFLVTLLAVAAGMNTVMRVFTMDVDLRGHVSPVGLGLALIVGVGAAVWSIFWPLLLVVLNLIAAAS